MRRIIGLLLLIGSAVRVSAADAPPAAKDVRESIPHRTGRYATQVVFGYAGALLLGLGAAQAIDSGSFALNSAGISLPMFAGGALGVYGGGALWGEGQLNEKFWPTMFWGVIPASATLITAAAAADNKSSGFDKIETFAPYLYVSVTLNIAASLIAFELSGSNKTTVGYGAAPEMAADRSAVRLVQNQGLRHELRIRVTL